MDSALIFDTANVYAQGAAEVVVGETLRAFPRESYVLATKVFGKMGTDPMIRAFPANISESSAMRV